MKINKKRLEMLGITALITMVSSSGGLAMTGNNEEFVAVENTVPVVYPTTENEFSCNVVSENGEYAAAPSGVVNIQEIKKDDNACNVVSENGEYIAAQEY